MATTKALLKKIKIEGVLQDLFTQAQGDDVSVTYNSKSLTLTQALAEILTSITSLPTSDNVDTKISTAISNLIGGAPETYDTLKEIADYIGSHQEVVDALNAAIGNKVDKEEGKGLSAEDFTTALKNKLESLPEITASDVESWNNKASTAVATTEANGLMSSTDKVRLDGIRGVVVGTSAPGTMLDGEVFVQIVEEA